MVEDLPVFNVPINQAEWDSRISKFEIVMARCSTKSHDLNIPPRLNILWLTTDMDDVVKADQRHGIHRVLEIIGYHVEFTQTIVWGEVDMLFISTDRREDVSYLLRNMHQRGLGLMSKYEVLVSGLEPPGTSPYYGNLHGAMSVGSDFGIYGMCMIHEYIMAFQDRATKSGRHTTMMLYLEGKIWNGVVKDDNSGNMYPKKGTLRRLLKSRKHMSGDAECALAALNLISNMRNVFVHTPPKQSTLKYAEEARCRINKLTKERHRPLNMPSIYDMQNDYSMIRRWLTWLTFVTGFWIDEYLKRYPVKDDEIHVIVSQCGRQKGAKGQHHT